MDHGKTTLIAALTGIDADRLPEEKARGMTIDIGFAHIDLDGIGRVSLVDVPGHERFIKNMLAGASGVDVAMLCVASDEGVKPQTREHFDIIRLLEARALVVALTKCDATDDETQSIAELDVSALLEGTQFAGAPIVRVSAVSGLGLDALKLELARTMLRLGAREEEGGWFLPIDRVFTAPGHGTVVTGTLARGRVLPGSEGELMPGTKRLRIRGVQVHGSAAEFAEAGQRTALNVTGAKREDLHRGQAIGSPGSLVESQCLNVRVTPLAEIKHGQRIRLHVGSGEFIGKIHLFDLAPGFGQIRLEEPLACARGQRGVLRRYSPPDVLAGVEIVTPISKPRRKNDREVIELLTEQSDSAGIVDEISRRPAGALTSDVCEALGRTPQELGDDFERLKGQGAILGFAGMWLTQASYLGVAERVRAATLAVHEAAPRNPSAPKAGVLKESGLGWPPKSFDRLIALMASEGLIVLHGAEVRHPDFRVRLSDKQQALLDRILAEMQSKGAIAPSAREIGEALAVPPQAVEEMWRLGVATGRMIRVDEGLYYTIETLEEIKAMVKGLGERFTVADFRDATGSSRKYALPLLIYLDELKFTRRVGDERIVLK